MEKCACRFAHLQAKIKSLLCLQCYVEAFRINMRIIENLVDILCRSASGFIYNYNSCVF